MVNFDFSENAESIIKVIGVGGGGGNAVNYMFSQGIKDVSFVLCNTDYQDLRRSPIPFKIQLGKGGLGAGSVPEEARKAAVESREEIENALRDNTQMAFITAGMGGGTGTGAGPVIAEIAKSMGILTVAIVTIPFEFEGEKKIKKALLGVEEMSKHVDALLVINNERLAEIFPDFSMSNAFAKADNILTDAARGIAEIITETGYINVDFADVKTIMKDSGVAIMNTGFASGNRRITKAIEEALNSPLLKNNNIQGAQRILMNINTAHDNQITMEETKEIKAFFKRVGAADADVIWGASFDDKLEESIKVTIIATGFGLDNLPCIHEMEKEDGTTVTLEDEPQTVKAETKDTNKENLDKLREEYYGKKQEMPNIQKEPEKVIEVITLDDWDSDEKIQEIESIPAYKRNNPKLTNSFRESPSFKDFSDFSMQKKENSVDFNQKNKFLHNNVD